ncbi:MAG: hypothetical protein R3E88_09195 [Myxococcota bacterium]
MEIRIDARDLDFELDALARSFVGATVAHAVRHHEEPIARVRVVLSRTDGGVRCAVGVRLRSGAWVCDFARAGDLSEAVQTASDRVEVALHRHGAHPAPRPHASRAA